MLTMVSFILTNKYIPNVYKMYILYLDKDRIHQPMYYKHAHHICL